MAQSPKSYWNSNILISSFRLTPAPAGTIVRFLYLDKDGDPDVLETLTIKKLHVGFGSWLHGIHRLLKKCGKTQKKYPLWQ